MSTHIEQLADRIVRLSPSDQLRLAADLIETGNPKTAEAVVRHVANMMALHRMKAAAKGERVGD